MSLSLLLDEHLSAVIAEQVRAKREGVAIQSIHHWRGGAFEGADDESLLLAAAEENLTLLTYDQRTIAPLLKELAYTGRDHSGVLFVDEQTIAPNDIGSLVRAILALWDLSHAWDWTNRVMYL